MQLSQIRIPRASVSVRQSALALEFMILTATRSNEARGATWSEIDRDARTWTIPAGRMKAKRSHRVPLSGRAMAVLDEARTLGPATGDALVFPGASKARPLAGATLLNLLERAGLDTTLHGFRSAFADWARERTNVPTAVAEAALCASGGCRLVAVRSDT